MKNVTLDALIPREDFEIIDELENSNISRNKSTLSIEDLSFDSFFFSSGIIKLAIRHKMPATSNIISTVVIILSAFTNSKLLYQKIHLHPVLQ